MRNLEATNPKGLRPSRFTSLGAGVSIILVLICVPFAWGAAPEVPLVENSIVQFLILVLVLSLALLFSSIVFQWDWRVKYFGCSMLCMASISFLALVPMFSVLIFGRLSGVIKACIFLFYLFSHVWWCRKFFTIYNEIFSNERMRQILYEEDEDVVYYKRRGDSYLLSRRYKFSQMPPSRYFLVFIFLGMAMVPGMEIVRGLTGVPFAHVFLTVAMLPVSWMSIGLAVRGILVCYHYPAQIKRNTGKEIYVDLTNSYKNRN